MKGDTSGLQGRHGTGSKADLGANLNSQQESLVPTKKRRISRKPTLQTKKTEEGKQIDQSAASDADHTYSSLDNDENAAVDETEHQGGSTEPEEGAAMKTIVKNRRGVRLVRKSSPQKREYRCGICLSEFPKQDAMWKHINATHVIHVPSEINAGETEKRFKCDVCEKTYKEFYKMKHHKKSHSGEPANLCPHCGKSFVLPTTLNRHILTIHKTPFRCEHCLNMFQNKRTLDKHLADRHGENTWKCEYCGKLCVTEFTLKKHVLHTHKDGRKLVCEHCDKSFSALHEYKQHRVSHFGLKPFKCDECGKRFSTASTLKYHRNIHTGKRRYSCNLCDTQFDHLSHFKVHARIHTGEKPYICNVCGLAFRVMNSLKGHMKGHSEERPFKCFVCQKQFKTKTTCYNHLIKQHPDSKAFECLVCKERFNTKAELDEHSSLHIEN